MKSALKKILLMQKITAICYAAGYMVFCFIVWEIRDPFAWLKHLHEYDPIDRIGILFIWSAWHFMLYGICFIGAGSGDKKLINGLKR